MSWHAPAFVTDARERPVYDVRGERRDRTVRDHHGDSITDLGMPVSRARREHDAAVIDFHFNLGARPKLCLLADGLGDDDSSGSINSSRHGSDFTIWARRQRAAPAPGLAPVRGLRMSQSKGMPAKKMMPKARKTSM